MNGVPYRITAEVTIVETNEVHNINYANAAELMEEVAVNVEMASIAFGRELKPSVEFSGDNATMTVVYTDTNEPYMIIKAQRHIPQ